MADVIGSMARARFEELNMSSTAVQNLLGSVVEAASRSRRSCFISGPYIKKFFACTSGRVYHGDL